MELYALNSWLEKGHMVEVTDDVQNIVRQIKEMDPRIHVFYNEQIGGFDLVEHCLDGAERLIFHVEELDARIISRLREGDSWLDGNPDHVVPDHLDFATKIEKAQDRERQEWDDQKLEGVRDAGERLAWALGDGKLGPGYMQSIRVKKDIRA